MSDPVISENGTKVWYEDGKLHRVDGPAVIYANGGKVWWVDGKRHRVDGPAIEYANGDKVWWVDGKLHRVGGPAVEYADGTKKWYVRNIKYGSAKEFQLAAKLSDEEFAEVILKHGNVG